LEERSGPGEGRAHARDDRDAAPRLVQHRCPKLGRPDIFDSPSPETEMPRSWVWLRLASLAFVVVAVGHSTGMFGHPGGDAGDSVLAAMREGRFEIMG